MISSNLEALLEFEERNHRMMKTGVSSTGPSSDQVPVALSEAPTPGSLLPPPRGSRATRTPFTSSSENWSRIPHRTAFRNPGYYVSSSECNPYINRAPTLEDMPSSGAPIKATLRGGMLARDAHATDASSRSSQRLMQADSHRISRQKLAQPSPGPSVQPCLFTIPSLSATLASKKILPRFIDDPNFKSDMEQGSHRTSPRLSCRNQPITLRGSDSEPGKQSKEKARADGKMLKTEGDGVLSFRHDSVDNVKAETDACNQPCVSHGPLPSGWTFESAQERPSTTEVQLCTGMSGTIHPTSLRIPQIDAMLNLLNISSTGQKDVCRDSQSFIDFSSSPQTDIALDNQLAGSANGSGTDTAVRMATKCPLSTKSMKARERSNSPKCLLPTTPILNWPSHKTSQRRNAPLGSSGLHSRQGFKEDSLPPTTNFLNMDERADLIRKAQKLTRVFGETPGAEALLLQEGRHRQRLIIDSRDLSTIPRSERSGLSVSRNHDSSGLNPIQSEGPLALESVHLLGLLGRRHSLPFSSENSLLTDLSAMDAPQWMEGGIRDGPDKSGDSTDADALDRLSSTLSFVDLSDEETLNGSGAAVVTRPTDGRRRRSVSSLSLSDYSSAEEPFEEGRRRKREKLAKLHRFLGSRIPTSLALGLDDSSISLPPVDRSEQMPSLSGTGDASRRAWLRRRRSSSVTEVHSSWSDDVDRLKEDLNEREKAINVKRAQKMEKVFGVAPPQTLYHTRHAVSPSLPVVVDLNWKPYDTDGLNVAGLQRNPNRSAYTRNRFKKSERPSTSESSQQLLPKSNSTLTSYNTNTIWSSLTAKSGKRSQVYTHYQHSLNSLNDILDRDDRESLAELHHYLNSHEHSPSSPESDFSPQPKDRRLSASSTKSSRRRSLPAQPSMLSISSEFSVGPSKPDLTDFQLRRRRAAKLTHFFGVDYRELINDVLESIESGLEHEQKRGAIEAEEVEVFTPSYRPFES
ncbi:hypothetical protein AX17_000210 [Amanita inopinata Kibby_2008]|nr:hypothetical protein AX17_000210 [Amanita inopinata Kibby_2008]